MFTDLLLSLGLTATEVKIYELLLEKGGLSAAEITKEAAIKRGLVYYALQNLQIKGLVLVTEGKKQRFSVAEPEKLQVLAEDKKREADRLQERLRDEMPRIASQFNISTGRPAVRVFEGIDGLSAAIADSLSADPVKGIKAYVDTTSVEGELAVINKEYVKKRLKKEIPKKILVRDEPATRDFFKAQGTSSLTEVRYLANFPSDVETGIEIYGATVSFLTLTAEKKIAVLLDDAAIARTLERQFDFLWSQAKT